MSRLSVAAAGLGLALSGCASTVTNEPAPEQQAPLAAKPSNIAAEDLVGRWGLAAYHKDADRQRTEAAARAQCGNPYTIARGPSGGVMMHLADATKPEELTLKADGGGRNYIGPAGPAADASDREIVTFNGRILVLRWVDREISGRYGTMVYVRCAPRA